MSEKLTLNKKAIRKDILILIIPVILESVFGILAEIVSAGLVGRLSAVAVASQGISVRVTSLLNVLWTGVRVGSMVYYVRLIGDARYGELKQGFKNICTVTIGIALAFVAIILLFPTQVVATFTTDPELVPAARAYLCIVILGLPAWVLMKMNGAMFNAMGDTKTPMYMQVMVNIINIGLGYLLIFVLRWDFYGAAIATAISQISGGVVGSILLNRKKYFKQAGKTGWKIADKESIKQTFFKAIPIAMEEGFWQLSAIVMTRVILVFGTVSYAGYQLATSAETMTEMWVYGFNVAAVALAGRAKGEKNGPLLREYYKQQMTMNGIISGVAGLVMILFPYFLMSTVTDNPALKDIGVVYLITMGIIYIPQNIQRTMKGTIYGSLNDTKAPMIIAGIGIWLVRVPASLLAAYVFKWPVWSIWIIIGVDQCIRFILMHLYMKHKDVMHIVENEQKKEAATKVETAN